MSLRVIVAALGSYGDVHPFLALGKELQRRGHDVVMIMPAMYESLTVSLGIRFVAAGTVEDFDKLSARPELWHPRKAFFVVAEGVADSLPWYYDAIVANHEPGRTVLVMSTLVLSGRVAQEKLGIPGVTVHLSPAIFLSAIEPPQTAPLPVARWMPRWWNRLMYFALDALVMDRVLGKPMNAFRAKLGMPPVKRVFSEWIHSPDLTMGLFPEWFAPPQADWPKQTVLTGFPLYDEADVTARSAELEKFLAEGSPPIAFTPGSAMRHGREFFAEAVKTCRMLGKRGIFLSRHKEHLPETLPAEICHIEFVPFSRLLPRCAALVHHGGIGTAAQGMAAGIPQFVTTMAHDQPDNAARLKRLGVGESLPAGKFTAERAAPLLRRIMDERYAAACLAIKERLAGEMPLEKSAECIEAVIKTKNPSN